MDYNLIVDQEQIVCTEAACCQYIFEYDPPYDDGLSGVNVVVFGLYVVPGCRRTGEARKILKLVIDEIRSSGYTGDIRIQAKPVDDSIPLDKLVAFYESMGLKIIE